MLPAYGQEGASRCGTGRGPQEDLGEPWVQEPRSPERPRHLESQGRASEERADGDLDPHIFMSEVRRVLERTSHPK